MRKSFLLLVGSLILGSAGLSAQATQLVVVTSVSNTQANAAIGDITVEARDAGNVIDAGYSATIDVSLFSGNGTLSGTTQLAMSNGTVTFTGLNIDRVGAKILRFTDGTLTDGDSNSFNITADRLEITVAAPASARANQTFTVTVAATDGTSTDTNFTGDIAGALSQGTGNLAGGTATAATGGTVSFTTLAIDTIGADKQITFTSTGLTAVTTADIAITADRLIITGGIGNTVAGATIGGTGITVEAQDGNGNTDTTFGGSVAVVLSSGAGTLAGTTPRTAVSGEATFDNLSINVIGAKELTFSSGALTDAVSASFNITPAADFELEFVQQPTTAGVGAVIAPAMTVRILDQFGNLTASTASVTLAIQVGTANLGGTNPRAAVAGVATFNDITLDTAGTGFVLRASSGALGTDDSDPFDVTATPFITVSAPNGGETWIIGNNATITWSSGGFAGNVDIELSTDGGSSFTVQLAMNTANDNSEQITVPANATTQARVRVSDTATGTIFDISNANFTIAAPAPAAVSLSAQNNPGSQTATSGSTRTALGFRLTETGGGSVFTVNTVVVTINTNGAAGVGALSTVSLVRSGSGTLATVSNGGTGWSAVGNVITVTFSALTSNVAAGGTGDFSVNLTFVGSAVPVPNPTYTATLAASGINSGTGVSGGPVNGNTITLIEQLPSDPLAKKKDDDDSCDLSTNGGPAWPVLAAMMAVLAAGAYRRRAAKD